LNDKFIKGLDLNEMFYQQAVKPVLDVHFPDLAYSAALLGQGSDVLGFDTVQSTDHDWGPRLFLFLAEANLESHRDPIDQVLEQNLPAEIHGYSTYFGRHVDGGCVSGFYPTPGYMLCRPAFFSIPAQVRSGR
jgi:hypothetical protein